MKSKLESVRPEELIPFPQLRRIVSGHIPALDGLRGVAILLVMIGHFYWSPTLHNRMLELLAYLPGAGWTGVELFFVLSGFLITGILLDSEGAENYLSSFYLRRALRILPLSYATLFVAFVLCPLLGKLGVPHMPHEFSIRQIWYWLYVQNWAGIWGQSLGYLGHFWSLAVEEQFYIVWPWVVLLTSRRTLARVCIVLPLASQIIRILPFPKGLEEGVVYSLTVTQLDGLALGGLVALIVRDETLFRRITPCLNYLVYAGLGLFGIVGLVDKSFNMWGRAFTVGTLPVAISFSGLLLKSVITTGSNLRFQRFLAAGWLRSCGKYSYAMYVLHFPMQQLYETLVTQNLLLYVRHTHLRDSLHHPGFSVGFALLTLGILQVAMLCVISYGLARLSWWALEGPFNDLKRHFNPRWSYHHT